MQSTFSYHSLKSFVRFKEKKNDKSELHNHKYPHSSTHAHTNPFINKREFQLVGPLDVER